jgi:hypothetical protein
MKLPTKRFSVCFILHFLLLRSNIFVNILRVPKQLRGERPRFTPINKGSQLYFCILSPFVVLHRVREELKRT